LVSLSICPLRRSGLVNLAPTSTGSATAIALIFPELKGKLNGLAIRVPLTNSSITDCVFELAKPTTVEEVNKLLQVGREGCGANGAVGAWQRGYGGANGVGLESVAQPSMCNWQPTAPDNLRQCFIVSFWESMSRHGNVVPQLASNTSTELHGLWIKGTLLCLVEEKLKRPTRADHLLGNIDCLALMDGLCAAGAGLRV
jgi:hypothetical protein